MYKFSAQLGKWCIILELQFIFFVVYLAIRELGETDYKIYTEQTRKRDVKNMLEFFALECAGCIITDSYIQKM